MTNFLEKQNKNKNKKKQTNKTRKQESKSLSTQIKASTSPSMNLKESDSKVHPKEFKFSYWKVCKKTKISREYKQESRPTTINGTVKPQIQNTYIQYSKGTDWNGQTRKHLWVFPYFESVSSVFWLNWLRKRQFLLHKYIVVFYQRFRAKKDSVFLMQNGTSAVFWQGDSDFRSDSMASKLNVNIVQKMPI